MTPEENKPIVSRFYDEVMGQGRVEVLDEVMDAELRRPRRGAVR